MIENVFLNFEENEYSKLFDNADFGYAQITVNRPLKDEKGKIVTEYCKLEITWITYKSIPYELSEAFLRDLVHETEILVEQDRSKKNQREDSEISVEVEVIRLGADFWRRLLKEAIDKKILNDIELNFLRLGINIDKPHSRLPTASQAKKMMKIVKMLDEEGILIQ